MNLRYYQYLTVIAEKGTLSSAAKALGISQPTLSDFLSETERNLGHTLFERKGKFLTPTPAGVIYLDTCMKILDVGANTYRSIANLTHCHQERFVVGVSPHRGSEMFSQIYPRFYQRYPNVRVDLKEGYMSELREGIHDGSITLALGTITSEELEQYQFFSRGAEELLLTVSSYHPLAPLGSETGPVYPSIELEQLRDTPFVMWGEKTTNAQITRQALKQHGIEPITIYESNNSLLINTMLQRGIGAGFLPVSFCLPGQKRIYFSLNPPLLSYIGVFASKSTILTTAQRFFIYLILCQTSYQSVTAEVWNNDTTRSLFQEFKED